MEIPSHFTSSQIDGISLVQIHTKFHDYSMSFIQILFVFHAGTWYGFLKSSGHGTSMEFAKKVMGFPSDSVSFSNQTKLPSKRHEKIHVTFFTGCSLKFTHRLKIRWALFTNFKGHRESKGKVVGFENVFSKLRTFSSSNFCTVCPITIWEPSTQVLLGKICDRFFMYTTNILYNDISMVNEKNGDE